MGDQTCIGSATQGLPYESFAKVVVSAAISQLFRLNKYVSTYYKYVSLGWIGLKQDSVLTQCS